MLLSSTAHTQGEDAVKMQRFQELAIVWTPQVRRKWEDLEIHETKEIFWESQRLSVSAFGLPKTSVSQPARKKTIGFVFKNIKGITKFLIQSTVNLRWIILVT